MIRWTLAIHLAILACHYTAQAAEPLPSFNVDLEECAFYKLDRTVKQRAFRSDDEGHRPSERAQRSPALPKLDEKLVHLSPKRDAPESCDNNPDTCLEAAEDDARSG